LPPEAPTADQWPDTLPALTAARINHILYSDARGGGHLHGYGWINGGDEFPAYWTVDDVLAAARHVIANGAKGKRAITGTYRGVTLRVAYTEDQIMTVTPVSGVK
ncbi:hypothetical protein RWX45_10455, partial [Actinomyces sp. MRS3W]|nr:hypothetical protein [Actinomyces sp. MRS3W]